MGCASSTNSQQDAQAMLEKQREIMLKRQREFEAKRAAQSGGGPAPRQANSKEEQARGGGAPPAIKTGGHGEDSREGGGRSRGPSNASVATPGRVAAHAPTAPAATAPATATPGSSATTEASTAAAAATSSTSPSAPPSTTGGDFPPEPTPESVEVRARRFTVDPTDMDKRKSKNLHDLGMYGKDVTRRASFNPRPAETQFSERDKEKERALVQQRMQEALAAEAAKMAAEEEAAAASASGGGVEPVVEETDEELKARMTVVGGAEAANRATVVEAESGDRFGSMVGSAPTPAPVASPAPAPAPAPSASSDTDESGLPKVDATKYTVGERDMERRKSKNIHDLGQYMGAASNFSRRASYVPPPMTTSGS